MKKRILLLVLLLLGSFISGNSGFYYWWSADWYKANGNITDNSHLIAMGWIFVVVSLLSLALFMSIFVAMVIKYINERGGLKKY